MLSVPASVAVHLEILQLPTSELPSRGAVAKQYRALALQVSQFRYMRYTHYIPITIPSRMEDLVLTPTPNTAP